jgi:putrescine transport system substrate-binding protein
MIPFMSLYFLLPLVIVAACLMRPQALRTTLLPVCACMLWVAYVTQPSAKPMVRILNYGQYVPQQLLDEFTQETGIAVYYDVMPDAEGSMTEFQLLMKCAPQDIILLSLYPQAQRLAQLGLLATIPQPAEIPYSLSKETISLSGDKPDNEVFCMPYVLGTSSVGFNLKRVQKVLGYIPDDPLDLVFDLEIVRRLVEAGLRLSIVDSGLEVCATVGLYLQSKWKRVATMAEQQAHVEKLRPYYNRISTLLYTQDMQRDTADVVFGWSTFLREAASTNDKWVVIEPEKAVAWVDVFVVPKNSPNYHNACKFLEFIARPRNIKIIASTYHGNLCITDSMHHRDFGRKEHYQVQRWWQRVKLGK